MLSEMVVSLAFLAGGGLSAPKSLAVFTPTLHQYEDGPQMPAGAGFNTGETVFLKFRVAGYQVSPDNKIDLVCRIEALDPDGIPFAEPARLEVKATLAPEDKEWTPIVRQSFLIPPLALSGTYRIAITVEDKLASGQAKTTLEFPVRGRKVEPSETITARNFRFFRSEDENSQLVTPVYHRGESVWVRFDIAGYKLGEKNRLGVSYGVSVIGPAGNTMYTQPDAATEQGESFYPKKYLPGAFSLNLDNKVRPGTYVIVLSLRDEVGSQTVESKHEFTVE
jgi:hypothetical protein